MITGDWFPEKLPAPFTRSIYPYPLHLPATRYPLQLDTPVMTEWKPGLIHEL